MNIPYSFLLFLKINLLYSVLAIHISETKIPLSNLIYNLTHDLYDDYVLYFHALSPVPQKGDILSKQLSQQPFMVFPYPLIPTTDWGGYSYDTGIVKEVRRFSRKQFDAIITPICTPYYPWPNQKVSYGYNIVVPRTDPRVPKNLTSTFPYTKVLIDDHGAVKFQEFFRFVSTTMFIYIENCADKTPMDTAARFAPTTPLVLIYTLRPYRLMLLREFKYKGMSKHLFIE